MLVVCQRGKAMGRYWAAMTIARWTAQNGI